MNFQDNFTETHLLFGKDVEFIIYDEEKQNNIKYFTLTFPKFKHCYFDYKFQNFLYMANAPLQDLTKNLKGVSGVNSFYTFCRTLVAFPDVNLFYSDVIFYSLKFLLPAICLDNSRLQIEGYDITQELFDYIIDMVLVSTEHKKMHDLKIIDPAMKAAQDKINKIKKQGKNTSGGSSNFNDSYMILTYEFHYSPEQILNMTMYCISTILKYTSKSINYKISLIGAGNGLSKKVHFITQKGK
jgi:hypothetical protein